MDNIKGFLETSFIDWPGCSCAVIFLGGCNFRCPFCHNHPLVMEPENLVSLDLDDLLDRLRPLRNWLGGICVSGGEPTLSGELPELLHQLKQESFKVKLDTNGSRPEMLKTLIDDGLVDMIAMDVKAPLEQDLYDRCCGVSVNLDHIRKSIELIRASNIDRQFRMTVVPGFHDPETVRRWRLDLGDDCQLKLQNYSPHSTLNPGMAGTRGFSREEFDTLLKVRA